MRLAAEIQKWVAASRALYSTTIVLPCIADAVIAWYEGYFSWMPFILVLVALFFANIGTNLNNDFFDYKSGVDAIDEGRKFKSGAEVYLKSGLTPKRVATAVAVCFSITAAIGLYLVFAVNWNIVFLGLAGIFIAVFYTAPPFKLGYRGFAELVCWLGNGLLAVAGTYYVLAGKISTTALLVSVPVGLLVTAIIYIGNVPDAEADAKVGKRTTSVRFGRQAVVVLGPAFYVVVYASLIAGIILHLLPVWTLLALLTVPMAIKIVRLTGKNYNDIPSYAPAIMMTVKIFMLTTLLIIVGFAIAYIL